MNSQAGPPKSLKPVSFKVLSGLLKQKLQSTLSFCPVSTEIQLGFLLISSLLSYSFSGRKDMDTE